MARALLGLQQLDRVGEHPAPAPGEAKDSLQRPERVGCALRRAAIATQLGDQRRHVLDPERGDPPRGKARQQVALELIAVGLERARVSLAGGNLRLEAGQPPAGDGVEAQPWRGRNPPGGERGDQLLAGAPRRLEVASAGAEVQAAGAAGADRELAVGLAVDAALDPDAAARARGHRWLPSGALPVPGS